MKKVFIFVFFISLLVLIGCNSKQQYNKQNVDEIIVLIDSLPNIDQINLEDEEEVSNIVKNFNALNELEKTKISNYYKLIEIEGKINYLKMVFDYKSNNIIKLIDLLLNKDNLSLKNENEYLFIENEVNNLSEYELEHFEGINKFNELKNIMDGFKQLIMYINESINSIPESITLNDENLIIDIKNKYENLNEDNKSFVENYEKLLKAEDEISNLKLYEDLKLGNAIYYIPDIVTSDTIDSVLSSTNEYKITWSSSNENLINFYNDRINVSKIYQTHKKQQVTVTATVELSNGEKIVSSKEIIVDPVKYNELGSTPVASYYQSTALNSYKSYNPRYLKDKTLFSEKTKEILDILYFAFGNVNSKGDIIISDSSILPELRKLKQNDVRILISIAGISSEGSGILANMTSDDNKLASFVKNIMDTVEYYNFDGVDIDWESAGNSSVKADGLNKLLKALREEMNERQDQNGSSFLLTTAIPATKDGGDPTKFDLKTINEYVDYVNVMSYELQMSNKATHGSALYTSSYDGGYGYSCDYAVNVFTKNGLNKSKIILGVSSYGKTFQLSKTSNNQTYPGLSIEGNKIQLPGAPNAYATGTVFLVAIQYAISTGRYKKYIEYNNDNQIVGSYLYSETDNIFITYDSEEVIEAKYNYANSYDGMGIMNWAYTQDTYDSYIETIYDIIKN